MTQPQTQPQTQPEVVPAGLGADPAGEVVEQIRRMLANPRRTRR